MAHHPKLKAIPRARGSTAGAVTPAAWNAMVSYVEELEKRLLALIPQSSPDISINHSANGFSAHLKRRSVSGASIPPATTCPFGSIVSVPDTSPVQKVILGGPVICGDDNYTVADYPIDLYSEVDTLLWLEVTFDVATDEDAQIFLPGIAASTGISGWLSGSSYPDNETPTDPADPAGKIILPIGNLVVTIPEGATRGNAAFYNTGCGPFRVNFCPPSSFYTRS